MNGPIRRVAYAVIALMLLLIGQVTYLQVVRAQTLNDDTRNVRRILDDLSRPRGPIITADGRIVAESVEVNDRYKYQRRYPLSDLFGQLTGYQSAIFGNTGLEASYNNDLTGRAIAPTNLADLVTNQHETGTVVLSVRADAQQIARDSLGGQRGAVVVLEPNSGAVIAMYANPSYDPNPMASHDPVVARAYFDKLATDPAKPSFPRSYAERYPPGSTFKVVTSAAALESDLAITPTSPIYPVTNAVKPPLTNTTIKNFGGVSCGGTLAESFRTSCNTTFAQIGLDLANRFPAGIDRFGGASAPPLDLANPGAATNTSIRPNSFATNAPQFAFAGIGQGLISASPLQMALVAASVANGGRMPSPHVAAEVRDSQGATVRRVDPDAWKVAMRPETAATLNGLMVSVVESGTGVKARIPGVRVAGKTGTAQHECPAGVSPCSPHAWFIGFAPAERPRYAIAVFVESGGNAGDQATGGGVAAPIAASVLKQLLALP
ncbi:MAG: peptidoglycan D,D-transpeptidase FtsI family protein [Acidimicrobiia bacterium]